MEKILTLDAEVVADTKLVIEGSPEVAINTSESITAEIAPDTYVLGSTGSFNTASSWVGVYVNELVQDSIGTGGTLADALDLIRTDVMDEIELGVNQVITQVENEYVSNSTLTTRLGSEIEGVNSSILNIENTYATQTEAQAYSIDAIKASFGGNSGSSAIEAYIGSIALTHVDATGAWAATTDVLTAAYNDISVELTDTREIAIGEFTEWVEGTTPQLGMFKQENGVWYQYRGGTLGINGDGWVVTPSAAALLKADSALAALSEFEDTTGVTLEQLQAQLDSEISSWFYHGVPTQSVAPWSDWIALEETDSTMVQDQHLGDLYYDLENEVAYRFVKSSDTGVYEWGIVSDDIIISALAKASTAQNTADGKMTITNTDSMPVDKYINGTLVSVGSGDMWIPAEGPNLPEGYEVGGIYIYNSVSDEWNDSTRATYNQYAVDIVNGTNQIDLSDHIDSLGWNTRIAETESIVDTLSTDLVQKAIEISNLNDAISSEEATRIQALLDEESARITDIAARVAEEAALDGKITVEETARINAIDSVSDAYKEYSRIVTLAIGDGILTLAELNTISSAQEAVETAKARFVALEADLGSVALELDTINTSLTDNAITVANLDNRITTEEAALVTAISTEQAERAADIALRVTAEAELDGKITIEEFARVAAIENVSLAYKEYSRIVALAMADGELTTEEIAIIEDAQIAVDAAKARFAAIENDVTDIGAQIGAIDTTLVANALTVANLDDRITADEAKLVSDIAAEQIARAADIAERIIAEGEIDGRVTAEEATRAAAVTEVSEAYQEYGRILTKAMADEVLTVDEQIAIAHAQDEVDLAKARFTAIEDFNSALDLSVTQLELDKVTLNEAITAETAARIGDILTATNAQLAEIEARTAEDALIDGRVTAEEEARIQASADLSAAYKEYTRVVTKALGDGVLTQEESDLIALAQNEVDAAKLRFQVLEIATETAIATIKKYESASGLIAAGFADGDITIFTSIEEPTTAEPFDLWRVDKNYVNIAEWEASDPETAYLDDEAFVYKYYDGFEWQFATANQVAMIKTTLNITEAKDLADGKVRIFNVTPFIPYDIGDLWILDGEIFKSSVDQTVAFSSADWGVATKYTDDTVANTKTVTFKQNMPPTALAVGDMWIDTSDSNHPKIWDGTAWGTVRDGAIALVSATASDALAIANTALNASDGTITVYYETVDPESTNVIVIGDIWVDIDSDPEMAYRWRVDESDSTEKWIAISDTGISAALIAAQTAQTTADGKIVADYLDGPTGPAKTADDVGDLWYDTTAGNKPHYWSGTVWVPIQDGAIAIAQLAAEVADGKAVVADGKAVAAQTYADNIVLGTNKIDLNDHLVGDSTLAEYVSLEIDKEVVVYSGPDHTDYVAYLNGATLKSGDLFIESTVETGGAKDIDVVNSYRYDGNSWVQINSNDNLIALADLTDSKRTIYSGTSAPTGVELNDIWMTTAPTDTPYLAEEMYIFGASGWYKATKYTDDQYAINIVNGVNQIDLLDHIGWATVTTVESQLAQELIDRADAISLVSGDISTETATRTAAVLAEQNARISAISTEVSDRNSAITTASAQLVIDYERYSNLIAKYMADGTLTTEELTDISVAAAQIDITKDRLSAIESTATLLDSAVTSTELAIAGITDSGGKIDQAKAELTAAYEAYTEVYDSAVVNGVIDAAEASAIESAAASLLETKTALQEAIDDNYSSLKGQIDGKITTHFISGVPTLSNLPASEWSTTILRNINLGDMYYDTDTSYAYRFKVATGVYSWERVQDSTIVDALIAASTAQGTADSKINSSIGTATQRDTEQARLLALPNPIVATGDLWIDTTENNAMYRFNGTMFKLVRDTTSDVALTDFINATYNVELGNLQAQVDGHAVTYFTETDPLLPAGTVDNNGDKWYKPSTNEAWTYLYTYTDKDDVVHPSEWIAISNNKVINALEQASITEAAADRSIKSFVGITDPINYWVGDTWMDDRTGSIYVCETASATFSLEDWVLVSTYSDDTEVIKVIDGTTPLTINSTSTFQGKSLATYIADDANSAVTVFSGTEAVDTYTFPRTPEANDIYIHNTTRTSSAGTVYDVVVTYKHNGTAWSTIPSNNDITALADISDGKRTIFGDAPTLTVSLDNVPNGEDNDLWIPSADGFDTQVPAQLVYKANELYISKDNEWELATTFGDDITKAKDDLIDLSKHDGAFNAARAEGNFTIYTSAPANPEAYDILVVPLSALIIDEYSATSADTIMLSDTVYWDGIAPTDSTSIAFKYWNPDGDEWVLCTPLMINAIKLISQSLSATAFTDSKARIFSVTPYPPYDVGDLWVQGSEGDILNCVTSKLSSESYDEADWGISSKYPSLIASTAAEAKEYTEVVTLILEENMITLIDNKSVSYFGDKPFLESEGIPEQDGDMWFTDGLENLLYVFIYDSVSPEWKLIEDPKAIEAFNNAAIAKGTADKKIESYVGTTALRNAKELELAVIGENAIGDLWTDTDLNNTLFRFDGTEFVNVRDTTTDKVLDNFLTVTYSQDMLDIGNQIDGKADTYFQGTKPYLVSNLTTEEKGYRDGDVWYDTTPSGDYIEAYRFSGTDTTNDGWIKIVDTQILDALEAASTAQATADGKIQNFTAIPTTPYYEGDTWMEGESGNIYVCRNRKYSNSSDGLSYIMLEDGTVTTTENYAYDINDWVLASKYIDVQTARAVGKLYNSPSATSPTAPASGFTEGDIWVVTDRWYDTVNGGTTYTKPTGGRPVLKVYESGAWVEQTYEEATTSQISWAGYASSLLTGPNGEITGWQYSDGGVIGGDSTSEFKISAETFRIDNGSGTGLVPFEIVNNSEGTPEINFKGKVTFASVTGTQGVALTENLPTYTEGIVDPTSTTEPIQSVYLNTTDSSLWTYTNSGWVPGGDPNAITQSTLNTALADNTTVINGANITTGTIDANRIGSGRIVNSAALNGDGTINESLVTMDINLDAGSIFIS